MKKSESGFTYIDVMIAIVILMVGILALMAAMSGAVLQAKGQEQQLIAKQVATSTLESIMSVKETDPSRLGWPAVGNVGSNPVNSIPQGLFVTGFNDIRTDAGPDQVIGTPDDTGTTLSQMQREIIITDVCDLDRPSYNCPTPGTSPVKIRTVQVNVRYFIGSLPRTERVSTVLTDYALAD